MKKNFKKTLAKVMAIALTVALAGTAAPEADAAKKIKLSSKSITVTKGKTKKVTIKNVTAKKVKKLTVKSSKKKIATVKKSGKTAFKVTGKKAGNAKVTVKVTVKGKKKATTLTLKVKVKNADKPKVTAAPTAAPTVAPTLAPTPTPANTNNENKDNGNKDNGNKDDGNKDEDKDLSKQVYGETDPYELTISALNEALATSDDKRALMGIEPNDRHEDIEFAGNTVKYTSKDQYNSGAAFYVKPIAEDDIKTEVVKNDKGQDVTKVTVNAEAADLTQYQAIEVELEDTYFETALKLFPEGESWWTRVDAKYQGDAVKPFYEGNLGLEDYGDDAAAYFSDNPNRTVRWDLSNYKKADLKSIKAIGISLNNAKGEDIKIKSIKLVGAQEPQEPDPEVSEISLGKSKIAVDETTSAEIAVTNAGNYTIVWASSDTAKVEVKADTEDVTKAIVTAKEATVETAQITATVTTGKGVKFTKSADITVISKQEAEKPAEDIDLTPASEVKFKTTDQYPMTKVSFDDKLTNVDLSKYDKLSVKLTVKDEEGNAFTQTANGKNYVGGKVALAGVTSEGKTVKCDGYSSSDNNAKDGRSTGYVGNAEFDVSLMKSITGINVQVVVDQSYGTIFTKDLASTADVVEVADKTYVVTITEVKLIAKK